jgi:hypothetical protein
MTNVSIDSIMSALVTAMTVFTPASGVALTAEKPIRSVQRYVASEFTTEEGFRRGIAGRCPAVRVRYAGSRTLRRTIGRRTARSESTFSVVCCTDSHKAPGDRESLKAAVELLELKLGSRKLSLAIDPIRVVSVETMTDSEQMLAYVLVLRTRHWRDYTVDPGDDVMQTATGEIHAPNTDDAEGRIYGEVDVAFEEEIA